MVQNNNVHVHEVSGAEKKKGEEEANNFVPRMQGESKNISHITYFVI